MGIPADRPRRPACNDCLAAVWIGDSFADDGGLMTFLDRLQACAKRVERHMAEILADRAGVVPPRLADAMRYSALGGGKRFRPFLLIESARLFDLEADRVLNAACALEFVHCYSLMHDDLPAMDNDDLRHGQPTAHLAYDEATAILAGDALLTLAFETLSHPATHPDAAVRAELVLDLAQSAGWRGMAGGQMLDLAAETTSQASLTEIARIQSLKTGALIDYACRAGATLAAAPEADKSALESYTRALGLAFQVADDLLDAEGDAAVVGKATGKDATAGKATFVSLLGLEGARAKLRELEATAVTALAPFGESARTLAAAANFVANRRH